MIMVLFDKSEYDISQEQAEKIEKVVNTQRFIKIEGELIATSAIMKIKKGSIRRTLLEKTIIEREKLKEAQPTPEQLLRSQAVKAYINQNLKNPEALRDTEKRAAFVEDYINENN